MVGTSNEFVKPSLKQCQIDKLYLTFEIRIVIILKHQSNTTDQSYVTHLEDSISFCMKFLVVKVLLV